MDLSALENLPPVTKVLAISLALAAVGVLVGFLLLRSYLQERAERRRRIERALRRPILRAVTKTKEKQRSKSDRLDRWVAKMLPQQSEALQAYLTRRLIIAELSITPAQFALLVILIVAIAFIGLLVTGFVFQPLGLAGLGVAAVLPLYFLESKLWGWQKKFLLQFPDAIDLMVRGVKSGLPITDTIESVATELEAPIATEFTKVKDSIRLGQMLEDALWSASDRIGLNEFNFFVVALSIQRETGGNIGETLANLSEILRKRKQMKEKIEAMTAEAWASATIIGALPFFVGGMLFAINPDYLIGMLMDPTGIQLAYFAGGSMLAGIGVMYKMVKFEI